MAQSRGRIGAALLAGLCIGGLTPSCSGDEDDPVVSGPSCDELCAAAAQCTEPPESAEACKQKCEPQRAFFNQTAWNAYAACASDASCESLDECMVDAVAATPKARADAFIADICDWTVGCSGGAISAQQCNQLFQNLGDDDEGDENDLKPFDFVRLIRASTVSCMSGCISDLSCAERDFGAASKRCSDKCGLGATGAFGGSDEDDPEPTCEMQHGDCGDNGVIGENQYGGCECTCDPGYVSLDWVCVPGCQMTGCGDHGECDASGFCSCEPDYYATPGPGSSGCTKMPRFIEIGVAGEASCGLRDDGKVQCWGKSYDPVIEEMPAENGGFMHLGMSGGVIGSSACALRPGGQVVCWGEISQPSVKLSSVSLDDDAACGLTTDGSVFCWGFSSSGATSPLERTGFESVTMGDRIACGIRFDHTLGCWGDMQVLNRMPEAIEDVAQVCARSGGGCARHRDGSIECFGFASYAHTPVPEPNSGYVDVTCGDSHACALREDGSAHCWGNTAILGPLQPPADRPAHFTDLEAGSDYTCGLRDDGSIGCWGRNTYNQAPAEMRPNLSLK